MKNISSQNLVAQNDESGIEIDSDCLVNGVCKFNVYETLGIRQSNPENSPSVFVQDVTLWATTFIGTILVISFIASAIMTILWWAQGNESMAGNGKKGMWYAVIGFLLVIFAYTIVKLIQFVAKG